MSSSPTAPVEPGAPAPPRRPGLASLALLAWAVAIAMLHARTMIAARGHILVEWLRHFINN
jgi:hypothetical protein